MTHNTYREAILGVDLGQSQHPTALALLVNLSQSVSRHNWREAHDPVSDYWLLSYAEVLPLGISFTQIARTITATLANLRRHHPAITIKTTVDATGLGAPAIELIQQEIVHYHSSHRERLGALEGIVFTGGATITRTKHNTLPIDLFHVPKLTLLNSVATAMENNLLKVPAKLPLKDQLLQQLQSLEIHHTTHANPTIRINRESDPESIAHADLVMALAMATWRMSTIYPNGKQSSMNGATRFPLH
jgi:hypothetical protein